MATLGVLTYTLPPGLKVKNNNFSKIVITSNINTNNNNNNNNSNSNNNNITTNNNVVTNKTKDLATIENKMPIMRKKQKLVPLAESNVANIQVTTVAQPPAKKPKLVSNNSKVNVVGTSKVSPSDNVTPGNGRKSLPPPQAVARRNARERNRVKQVNNGFAALRQRIPEEVAEAFEAAGCGRGTAKKLSKVETLRMAVEYIRSLERLLGLENSSSLFSDDDDAIVIKSESSPVSMIEENYEDSNYDPDESAIYYSDNLPDITMLNGQQYLRIPGTNTYQLLTSDVFENEENFQPMVINNCSSTDIGLSPPMDFNQARSEEMPSLSLGQLAPVQLQATSSSSPAPSSPSLPLQQSPTSSTLSPAGHLVTSTTISNHQYLLSQLQMHQNQLQLQQQQQQQQLDQQLEQGSRIKLVGKHDIPLSTNILYRTELAPNCSSPHEDLSNIQGYYDQNPGANERHLYDGFVLLKKETEQDDNTVLLDTSSAVLSDESMMEAIDWWDSHTPKSDSSGIL